MNQWQKQSLIPGQDCETICGLLDSIEGKLDDAGGSEADSGSGQIMAYINEPPAESVVGASLWQNAMVCVFLWNIMGRFRLRCR